MSAQKICIIPARGGSKRIPRKNIRPFHGKPMIAWSIEAALNSKLFDQVLVSTDDQEIAAISVACGADASTACAKPIKGIEIEWVGGSYNRARWCMMSAALLQATYGPASSLVATKTFKPTAGTNC